MWRKLIMGIWLWRKLGKKKIKNGATSTTCYTATPIENRQDGVDWDIKWHPEIQLQVHPENMGTLICSSQKCVCIYIYIYLYNQVSAIVPIPFVLIKSLISCLTKSHSLIKLCCFQKNWCFIPKFLSLISWISSCLLKSHFWPLKSTNLSVFKSKVSGSMTRFHQALQKIAIWVWINTY